MSMQKTMPKLIRWMLVVYLLVLGYLVGGGFAKSISGNNKACVVYPSTMLQPLLLK